MANAGNYGVNIGTGAASGAGMGAFLGPWGALIGGGLGGLAGGISTLLSSSDEAKQREKLRDAYMQKAAQSKDKEWDQLWENITGIGSDPMYQALKYDPYDPEQTGQDADAYVNGAIPEQEPNYGALMKAGMSLGSTVGGLSRMDAAQQQLDALVQSRKNGQAQAQGSAWGGYSKDFGNGSPWQTWSQY